MLLVSDYLPSQYNFPLKHNALKKFKTSKELAAMRYNSSNNYYDSASVNITFLGGGD